MKISEKFESIRICDDEKARRVLNVSTERANISSDEIENGVTIERLEEIGVPVFRYSTQVTIHGKIPDFNPESRPLGYKAIFLNGNGSLGVKYIAIDGAKKKLICAAARLSSGGKFSASINSSGLELVFMSHDKESAISTFRSFPKDLIIGGLYAARGMYGEFYVVADIGAIDQKNLWPFIGALYGFNSQTELEIAQRAQDDADKARRAQWEIESAARNAERDRILTENKTKSLATLRARFKPLANVPAGEMSFVTVSATGETWFYKLAKRGPQLCCAVARFDPAGELPSLETSGRKLKRFADQREKIARRVAAGECFAVN
jgi:hypothetical protein